MKKARYILAMVLAVAMILTTVMPTAWASKNVTDASKGTEVTFDKGTTATADSGDRSMLKTKLEELSPKGTISKFELYQVDADEQVRIIVVFEGDALIDNYEVEEANSESAKAESARLTSAHNTFLRKLGFDYTMNFDYTALINGVAITTAYKNIKQIETMAGVSAVYLSNSYDVPESEISSDQNPDNAYSTIMTGAADMVRWGYDGDGVLVAVLDTGVRTTHEAFQDYGIIDTPVLTEEDVASIETTVPGAYLSAKIPFAYDYADLDTDVSDKNGHGTHTSGTSVGCVMADDGAMTFYGAAPAAQLVAMKIFHDVGSGTNSDIYFAALEDCYRLGVDVVNMSIGAQNGKTYDSELEGVFGNIYDKLDKAGIIVCCSAGNEYSMAYGDWINNYYLGVQYTFAEYVDYGVTGSPATYRGNLSVASTNNIAYPSYGVKVGDVDYAYSDTATGSDVSADGTTKDMRFRTSFAGQDLEYIVIGGSGLGSEADFAATADVEGKIALVKRGDLNFSTKLQNAYNAGAAGMICYNNQAGQINMSIATFYAPAVSITQAAGAALIAAADENGIGTLHVNEDLAICGNPTYGTMSDFSSWGTTSDLAIKPMITAPGGMVYSSVNTSDSAYEVYSGTSMAAPNATGMFATVIQAISSSPLYAGITKAERAHILEATVENTAIIQTDSYGDPVSPRKQGAGLINAVNAGGTPIYIDEPLVELGDDPERSGDYVFDLTIKNPYHQNLAYSVDFSILTDYPISYRGDKFDTLQTLNMISEGLATGSSNCVDNIFTINANQSEKKIKIFISLTEEGKATLDYYYANGIYFEGYITLSCITDNISVPDIHATYLGFYGDWTDGAMLDTYDFSDEIDVTAYIVKNGLSGTYDYNSFLDQNIGINEAYAASLYQGKLVSLLGDSYWAYVYYEADRNAISNETSDSNNGYIYDAMVSYPMQLRNARHLIMLVFDQETGELYYVDDTEYLGKAYLDDSGYFSSQGTFIWDGTDMDGNYVPNETKVDIKYYAWLDYETELESKFRALNGDYAAMSAEEWDDEIVWEYGLTVDTESPKLDDAYLFVDMLGDVNQDDMITAADAVAILRYDIQLDELTDDQKIEADVNENEAINAADAAKILRYLVGLDELPILSDHVLRVTVSDNQYLDYIGLYDGLGKRITGRAFVMDKGASTTVYFDLDGYTQEIVYVAPMDYASNFPAYEIQVNPPEYTPINDIRTAMAEDATLAETYTTVGAVTFIDGKNVYLSCTHTDYSSTDDYYGICAYMAETPTDLEQGDVIKVTGTTAWYKGLPELSNAVIDEVKFDNSEDDYSYDKSWNFGAIDFASVEEYAGMLYCSQVLYDAPEDETDSSFDLEVVSVTANGDYYNIVVTDGTQEMTIYKAPAIADYDMAELGAGDKIGAYLTLGIYNTLQWRVMEGDMWVTEEATEPEPEPDITAGQYLISVDYNDATYYMTDTVNSNKLTSATTEAEATVWTIAAGATEGTWTIKSNAGYISAPNSTNLTISETAAEFKITKDADTGVFSIEPTTYTTRLIAMKYDNNNNPNCWGAYAKSNNGSSGYVFNVVITAVNPV